MSFNTKGGPQLASDTADVAPLQTISHWLQGTVGLPKAFQDTNGCILLKGTSEAQETPRKTLSWAGGPLCAFIPMWRRRGWVTQALRDPWCG